MPITAAEVALELRMLSLSTALRDAINRYARSVGGDPGRPAAGDFPRLLAEADIEEALVEMIEDEGGELADAEAQEIREESAEAVKDARKRAIEVATAAVEALEEQAARLRDMRVFEAHLRTQIEETRAQLAKIEA